MDPFFYFIAIMGCGDGGNACQQARVEPVQYASIAACRAAMPQVLARNSDIDYPVVAAACRANGQRLVQTTFARTNRG